MTHPRDELSEGATPRPLHVDDHATLAEYESPRELDGRPVGPSQRAATNLDADKLLVTERMLVHQHRQWFTWALVALVALGGGGLLWGACVVSAEQWPRLERAGVLVVV